VRDLYLTLLIFDDRSFDFASSPGVPASVSSRADDRIDVARGMRELVDSLEADPYVDGAVFGWYEAGSYPFNIPPAGFNLHSVSSKHLQ
jgi:hypothetical protein